MSLNPCRLPWATATVIAVALVGSSLAARAQPTAVTTYHNGNGRAGDYVIPQLTLRAAAGVHLDPGFDGTVKGHVYAQPLYWTRPAQAGGELVVATELNHVVALDAISGKVIWDRALGPSVPSSELPCGNITPLGITGTPVIDVPSATVFVVAQVNAQGAPAALAYRLSLQTGATEPGWPVDIGAGLTARGLSFVVNAQGERAALTLASGQLYVPFGGRFGDCGTYHGWVIGVQLQPPELSGAWRTRALRGGIWSVGGAVEADGDLFVTTGNTGGTTVYGDGESVVRLPPTLEPSTATSRFFAPSNWLALDAEDLDLGGATAVPLNVGGRRLIVALGKDGKAYLLDRTNLGGIGGALAVLSVSGNEIKGGPATWSTGQEGFVAFAAAGSTCPGNRQGLVAVKVTGGASPSLGTAWCAGLQGAGSPIVTSTDGRADRIVWIVGASGDERLHGFDAATGAVVFGGGGTSDRMSHVHQFSTVLAADGRLYVPADGRIYAFIP